MTEIQEVETKEPVPQALGKISKKSRVYDPQDVSLVTKEGAALSDRRASNFDPQETQEV